ncbi:DUF4283 domain-containing protein [Cephalotus follicularis]|uniref:DUF4283 domain-containing protein n=1 Tax=Cephalotus follicularis TaxID=3775 RepID=A0A1Q3DKT0_CEPFO|nr:DUF4283 domain-containing protein [Cephalotus follicularis]
MADKVEVDRPPNACRLDKGKEPLVEDSLSEANFPVLQGNASTFPSSHPSASPVHQWRQLFLQSSRVEDKLSFFEQKTENGVCIVEPPDEVFEEGVKTWSNTLVGYFVGKRIPFKIVKENLEKKWKKWGSVQVISGVDGNFLFRFSNSTSCEQVLSNGPWEVWGAYLTLKRWEEGISLCKESFSRIPIWVKLTNIPAELWTRTGLSYIASALGMPLCMDAATAAGNRLSFARVCVEMKAHSNFPHSFKVRRRSGILADIQVQYVWKPSPCSVCNVFDHSSKQCHLVDKRDPTTLVETGVAQAPLNEHESGMAQVQSCPHNHEVVDPDQVVQRVQEEAVMASVQINDQSDIAQAQLGGAGPSDSVLVEKKNDPNTPLKLFPEAAPLSSASMDSNTPGGFRYTEGSSKKKKKKRDATRRGLTPSR